MRNRDATLAGRIVELKERRGAVSIAHNYQLGEVQDIADFVGDSLAEVKAESDICCTSANAVGAIENLDAPEILFVPDQYLGHYISTKTNKKMILSLPTPRYILRG